MIEVEIRGKLDDAGYQKLKSFLETNGTFAAKQSREMYLLYDYPGYDADPTKRSVDIRLRNTDGFCEIMLKTKASDGNTARKEVSLALKDHNLDNAKSVLRALGCGRGLKMLREKEIYNFEGVEWSLVNCPPRNIRYFEAEKEAPDYSSIPVVHKQLSDQAARLGQHVLNEDKMREFIYWLDEQVNVEVEI